MMDFTVIIPARYASSRLAGKPLLDINGKPLLRYAYETAQASRAVQIVIVTDDTRIETAAHAFGAEVLVSTGVHTSGTDRVAEAAEELGLLNREHIIVNLQGDEYGLDPGLVNQVAIALHRNPSKQMATLSESMTDKQELHDENIVKVVSDFDCNALYFSRAPIPWNKVEIAQRHIGLYAYTGSSLQAFTELSACELEQAESLEQLRALYHGWKIHVEVATASVGFGVDTPADLERARRS